MNAHMPMLDLPEATDAERTIIGALLLDKSRLFEIAAVLTPDDFSLDSHRRIFAAMVTLGEQDSAIDIVTLSHELGRRKEIEVVGGVAFLAGLTDGLPRRPEIDNYLRIVKDKAIARALIGFCSDLSGRAYDQSQQGLEIASWAISALSAIADCGAQEQDVYEASAMAAESEERLVNNPPESPAIPTGLQPLDEFTGGGIRPGELWIIGAPPSRGKTTLARQIMMHCIRRGVGCYAHSGEMSKESWFDVTACLIADLPGWKSREPRLLNLTDKERMRWGIRQLAEMPFFISDKSSIHLDRLIWNATRKRRKDGVQVVFVDYAQIVTAPGRDRREEVTNVAQRMRRLAKDENLAVVLLSQSPRPEGRAINARPKMYDLKESGDLEIAAHTIILPYCPIDTDTGVFVGQDELIIGKQRWGALGSIPVKLNGQFLKFEGRQ